MSSQDQIGLSNNTNSASNSDGTNGSVSNTTRSATPPPTPPTTNKYDFNVPVGLGDNITLSLQGLVKLTSYVLESNITGTFPHEADGPIPLGSIFGDLKAEEGVEVRFSGVMGMVTGKGRIFFQKDSTTVVMMELIVKKEGHDIGPGLVQLFELPAPTTTTTSLGATGSS